MLRHRPCRACCVTDLRLELGLADLTVVGHDAGGMVAYAYLRTFGGRCVVMNVALPGVDPWDDVERNPYIWHFAFHRVPRLPELLVQGHQAEYFAYFYEAIAHHPERITPDARAEYARAYASDTALKAGFDWYRAFPQDVQDNAVPAEPPNLGVAHRPRRLSLVRFRRTRGEC